MPASLLSAQAWLLGIDTRVGYGSGSDACDSSRLVCAGAGDTFGWGSEQATAVKIAIDSGGAHPNAPVPRGQSEGFPQTGYFVPACVWSGR